MRLTLKSILLTGVLLPGLEGSSQNLLVNPEFQDINLCCERNMHCQPKGWFSIGGMPVLKTSAKKKEYFFPVISPQPVYSDSLHIYAVGALLVPLETGCRYKIAFDVPGNDRIDLMYAFLDTFAFKNSADVAPLQDVKFTKTRLKGTGEDFHYTGSGSERYFIFEFLNPDSTVHSSKLQRISGIRVQATRCREKANRAELNRRMTQIYAETRRHDFIANCEPE